MSAPFRMTAQNAKDLAAALDGLSEITRQTGIKFDTYQPLDVQVSPGSVIQVRWDHLVQPFDESYGEYVVDDQVGS